MELGPNQEKWLEAIESGDYLQGTGQLCQLDTMNDDSKLEFCCLGVACEIFELDKQPEEGSDWSFGYSTGDEPDSFYEVHYAPPSIIEKLALRNSHGAIRNDTELSKWNDTGKSFHDIAAFIRANPELVFTEAK